MEDKKIKNREYQRKWQLKNRELNILRCKEYKGKNKEKITEYRLKNIEEIKIYNRKYYLKNREYLLEYGMNYRLQMKQRKENSNGI